MYCMKHRTWTWSVYDTYAVLAIWHVLEFTINAFQEVFNTCSSLRTEDLKVFLWVSCFIRESFDWIGAIFVDNNLVSGRQWHGMMARIVLAVVILVAAGIRLEGWRESNASGWKFSSVEVHSKWKMGDQWVGISSGPGTWKKHHVKPAAILSQWSCKTSKNKNHFTRLEDTKDTTPEILVFMVYTGVPHQGNS